MVPISRSSPAFSSENSNESRPPINFDSNISTDQRRRPSHRRQVSVAQSDVSAMASPSIGDAPKLPMPVQKRQRVTRACDECRRKKIKCDGKQPCTHCTVYSYLCTYDQPSNRRRNLPSQYVENLEQRLEKAEAILKVFLPDLNLDDPKLDISNLQTRLSHLKVERDNSPAVNTVNTESAESTQDHYAELPTDASDEGLLESMLDQSGTLDLDDQGHWDYHGQSSGIMFMQQLRKLGNIMPDKLPKLPTSALEEPTKPERGSPSTSPSAEIGMSPPASDLPPREVTRKLCEHALEEACTVIRFMHKPTFFAMLDRIYETPVEQYTNEEHSFLPLLYLAAACGCLFGNSDIEKLGYKSATGKAYQYYKTGRQMLDITECRDLTSLQAIIFMIIFLQSSASISTCYSYIGIALRSALRLGLHRSVTASFNYVEQEMRKRVFWVVRKMDVHVSTVMGLPSMLTDDDIDQEYPLAVDDEYITPNAILPMPEGYVPTMAGIIAHIELGKIVTKVTNYIYPVKTASVGHNHTYLIRHSKIREIEGDLEAWLKGLPEAFKPGVEAPRPVERIRQLLRIGYAHVQMIMYRPFLHYVKGARQNRDVDKRSYACAAACVTVARNAVHITASMKKQGFLNGSYWFTMYTTYFAILALLYFILENPDSTTARDGILRDAIEGKNTLAGLAKNSIAADRCAQSLNSIFKHLPEKLRNRQPSSNTNRKRPSMDPSTAAALVNNANAQGNKQHPARAASESNLSHLGGNAANRTNTVPGHILNSGKKAPAHSRRGSGTQARMNSGSGPGPTLAHGPSHLSTTMTASQLPTSNDTKMADAVTSSERNQPQMQMSNSQYGQQQTPSPQQRPQQQQQAQQQYPFDSALDSSNYIPDLMPIMFPTDDPFAYPTQPMSTLEDSAFKYFENMNTNLNGGQPRNGINFSAATNQSLDPLFDLKHAMSMPDLTAATANGNSSSATPNSNLSGAPPADSDLTAEPGAMGPLFGEFNQSPYWMPPFGQAEEMSGQFKGVGSLNTSGPDTMTGDGMVTSSEESGMHYTMSDPFLWGRGNDSTRPTTSNQQPTIPEQSGEMSSAQFRQNERPNGDVTQPLFTNMQMRPQPHPQAASQPQSRSHSQTRMPFRPRPGTSRQQQSQLPSVPGTPSLNPVAANAAAAAMRNHGLPQTPAPTPTSPNMSLNPSQRPSPQHQQQQQQQPQDDPQDYAMGMGIGFAVPPYANLASMEVNMGLDNLGMPVMGSGTATGVQSPNDPADGAATNNNNNNNGAGNGMDTDMGGFSIGSGSSTPNVGPFEDDASVSVPGTGTRGGTPNTDGSGGAVEWNRWMNVGGM